MLASQLACLIHHGCPVLPISARCRWHQLAAVAPNITVWLPMPRCCCLHPPSPAQVAAVGGSLAGYFGVFHRLMAAKLREAAAAADERALEALARGLKEDCCASQHTYVHAQQVDRRRGQQPLRAEPLRAEPGVSPAG